MNIDELEEALFPRTQLYSWFTDRPTHFSVSGYDYIANSITRDGKYISVSLHKDEIIYLTRGAGCEISWGGEWVGLMLSVTCVDVVRRILLDQGIDDIELKFVAL